MLFLNGISYLLATSVAFEKINFEDFVFFLWVFLGYFLVLVFYYGMSKSGFIFIYPAWYGSEYVIYLISSGNWLALFSSDAAFLWSLYSPEVQWADAPLQRSSVWTTFALWDPLALSWHFGLLHLVGQRVLLASCGWRPWGLQGTLQSRERSLRRVLQPEAPWARASRLVLSVCDLFYVSVSLPLLHPGKLLQISLLVCLVTCDKATLQYSPLNSFILKSLKSTKE